jgi:hypothetical protein
VAVGAHSFDHWFQWAPHADRATLLASCRLDPNQPYVVYAGSAPFTADDEAIFVSEWLSRVREHPRLRDVGIIARPHPYNTDGWDALRDEPGRVAVWPRGGEVPESAPSRQAYFDTLHYSAAVVGVSTTAFLEAAILGKPSFTLRNDYFPTPPGTLHFAYIADDGTGAGTVTVAETWKQHFAQITAAIDHPSHGQARTRRFVTQFLRPHGLHEAAAERAADAIEDAARAAPDPGHPAGALSAAIRGLTPAMTLFQRTWSPPRLRRRFRRSRRDLAKTRRRLIKRGRREIKHYRRARAKHKKRWRADRDEQQLTTDVAKAAE